MTVLQLITSSLRLIGASGPGRSFSASHSWVTDALWVLNSMIEAWNTERMVVYFIDRNTYSITGGTQTYTIGSGGDFDTTRPVRIERAGVVLTDQEVPLAPMTYEDWARVAIKDAEAAYPQGIYCDNAYPLATLTLWPVPTDSNTLALYEWSPLSQFSAATDTVAFPPGYADALRYNLAVRLAPEWGRPIRPDVMQLALDSKAWVKRLNLPSMEMAVDPALLAGRGISLLAGTDNGAFADAFAPAFA